MDKDLKSKKRTTVRFTDEEFDRIKEESKLSGLSIPTLLKKSHFSKIKLQLLFNEDDRHKFATELRRIGNNVNQIARHLNSGALEGWHSEFLDVAKKLSELCLLVSSVYGLR